MQEAEEAGGRTHILKLQTQVQVLALEALAVWLDHVLVSSW